MTISEYFYDDNEESDVVVFQNRSNAYEIYSNLMTDLVVDGHPCSAALSFRNAFSIKPHVVLLHLNENWGGFSTPVLN
jgi:hypothetical protein